MSCFEVFSKVSLHDCASFFYDVILSIFATSEASPMRQFSTKISDTFLLFALRNTLADFVLLIGTDPLGIFYAYVYN